MGRPQQKKPGGLAWAVASEIRREMGDRRVSARSVARHLGRSTPYVTARLNGETDFSLNDIDGVCAVLGLDPVELIGRAERRSRSVPDVVPFDVSKLPPVVGREHLEGLRAVAEDQYTMPSEDDHTP